MLTIRKQFWLALAAMVAALTAMVAALALAPVGVQAQGSSAPTAGPADVYLSIAGLTVGFNGVYKVGVWTPVEVELRGGSESQSGRLVLATPDIDDVMTEVVSEEIILEGDGSTTVRMFVRFGAVRTQLRATFVPRAGGTPTTRIWSHDGVGSQKLPEAVASHRQLVLGVGPDVGLDAVAALHRMPDGTSQLAVAKLAGGEQLPEAWYGYEGVDWLVLATSDAAVLEGFRPAQLDALAQWVNLGGQLLISTGARAEQVFAADSVLAELLPAAWNGQSTVVRRTSELESYLGDTVQPILLTGSGISAPLLSLRRGRIEVQQANAPLVLRTAAGFGEVALVALDLDQPPLADWPTRDRFVSKLVGRSARSTRESGREGSSRLSHSGVTDLSGQLRAALDQYEGVNYVPFVAVALAVLVYILLIGPGDYLLVRRVFKRMPSTWVTFPLLVVAASVAAYAYAQASKGDAIRANLVSLVDYDVDSGRVRGSAWVDAFSPAMTRYDVTVQPRQANGEVAGESTRTLVAWMGGPGRVLGGMDRTSSPTASFGSYRFAPELNAMEGVPIPIWASKSFTARWHGQEQAPLRVNLRATVGGEPEGTITNQLDIPLKNCLLAYGRWAYAIPDLAPGESIQVDSRTIHRELRDELTGRRTERDENSNKVRDYRRPYDDESVDVPTILQQMMFYEAAGGLSYTGLYHRYQPFTDLSRQLSLDRGLLLGFVERPGADLLLTPEGEPTWNQATHVTCLRFVFDVRE